MIPVFEELVGDVRRGFEHAARIAAQIEHQPAQPCVSPGAEMRKRLVQVRRSRVAELGDAGVAVAARQGLGADGPHVDLGTLEIEGQGLGHAFAAHRQPDARAGEAAQALDRLVEPRRR